MGVIKEEAKKLIDRLPEQVSWDDIMYEFYVKQKLTAALKAADEGKVISHREVKKRLLSEMNIEWTEPALLDLESIRDYIARDSEYYAIRFLEKVIEAVESLEKFPEVGRVVPEAERKNIRELLFHNYRIIYRVEAGRILVLTIIHGARDLTRKRAKPWDVV